MQSIITRHSVSATTTLQPSKLDMGGGGPPLAPLVMFHKPLSRRTRIMTRPRVALFVSRQHRPARTPHDNGRRATIFNPPAPPNVPPRISRAVHRNAHPRYAGRRTLGPRRAEFASKSAAEMCGTLAAARANRAPGSNEPLLPRRSQPPGSPNWQSRKLATLQTVRDRSIRRTSPPCLRQGRSDFEDIWRGTR